MYKLRRNSYTVPATVSGNPTKHIHRETVMTPWTYNDYQISVARDVAQGLKELGFNIDQSLGFAHAELSLRLDEFPEENVLALTALAMCAHQHNTLSTYTVGDEIFDEIAQAYANNSHLLIATRLDETQKQEFLRNVIAVKKILRI